MKCSFYQQRQQVVEGKVQLDHHIEREEQWSLWFDHKIIHETWDHIKFYCMHGT